jgi:hypothetical protein
MTMKTTRRMSKIRMGTGNRARTKKSRIQWPTGQEIEHVSKSLARVSRQAIRCEVGGDYFKSGDLAYQIQEILRATAELLKKSQRIKN